MPTSCCGCKRTGGRESGCLSPGWPGASGRGGCTRYSTTGCACNGRWGPRASDSTPLVGSISSLLGWHRHQTQNNKRHGRRPALSCPFTGFRIAHRASSGSPSSCAFSLLATPASLLQVLEGQFSRADSRQLLDEDKHFKGLFPKDGNCPATR